MNLLQEFIKFLLDQKSKPSFLTIKNYKADIRQFINWFEKEAQVAFEPSIITKEMLERYKDSRDLSPTSSERHTSSLRRFFSFLKTNGIISQNPLQITITSAQGKVPADPWKLRNFKTFLYEYKKSDLTIKNYLNDIKSFFSWLSKVSLVKNAWEISDKNLLNKINFAVIDEYKQRLIASNFSPRTINRKLSSLRNYIKWGIKQGLISSDQLSMSSRTSFGISENAEMLKPASPAGEQVQHDTERITYSSFPPKRLAQKSIKSMNLLFDNLFILPIAKTMQGTQYLFWKASGKKIFHKNHRSFGLEPQDDIKKIVNIKKDFYAPLNVSLHYLPTHKKVWHYLRYRRPNWYKRYHSYSITHYLHFAILFILASAVGFGFYNSFFADLRKENQTFAAIPNAPARILSFQGKLTDSSNNPITKDSSILFSLYNDENASSAGAIWQETNVVKPDSDGVFSTLLGKNNPISDNVFSQNSKLFLGITVGNGPELSPRQAIATVHFASNAETLQGLEPIINTTKVSNVVLALDSSGNLSIAGSKAHTFQTIGGQFILSGKILSLTTIPGSNSNIEIVPDGIGKIDLSKPIQNSSNNNNLSAAKGAVEFDDNVAILATTSAQAAFYINQDSTGPLISASTSGIAKFIVDNDGAGTFAGSVAVNGSNLTSTATTFNLLNSTVTTLNLGGGATNLVLGASTGTITLRNATTSIQGDVTLGDATTDKITFTGRVAQDSSLIPITTSGTNNLGSSDLPWDNAYINNILTTGNLGIGTTSPLAKLDVQDSQSASVAAQIYNTNTGTDADGLVVKLGNTSSSAIASTNHFVSFETAGIGIVGSIQGNGGKGVTYATSGIADFAEYFKKNINQTIEYGSLVCLKDNGLAIKCDTDNNKVVGVASEHPAFLGGENLGQGSITVGLVGQVDTFVVLSNGPIKAGDPLSASEIPGVAVKTTSAGQIVGKALENIDGIDEAKVVGFYDPDNKEYRSKADFPDIPLKSNIVKVVKINTFVNVSWYDPSVYLAKDGNVVISNKNLGYTISNSNNDVLDNIGAFFKVIAANINAGLVQASEVVTNSLIVTADSIIVNGQNLRDYIVQTIQNNGINSNSEIVSPIIKTNTLSADMISPLGKNLIVKLATSSAEIHPSAGSGSEFIIQNASGSAVVKIDDAGNASFSGRVSSQELAVSGDASVSGTLRANNIIADSISGLKAQVSSIAADTILNTKYLIQNTNYVDIASYSAQLAYVTALKAERAQFDQGLMVFGTTSLLDASITGQLSIGGSMVIVDNSIETLGTDLSLQNLKQGGLSIMGGLIYVDTQGDLKVKGDVSISGKLAVNIISPLPNSDLVVNNASGSAVLSINQKGDVIASGSARFAEDLEARRATFAKLNLNLVEPALAISETELIASSSAGAAFISPFQTEVTIKNPLVTDKSLIYITPVGTPSAQSPFLMRQIPNDPAPSQPNGSFTIGVESPNKNPIPFNWLIVN